jgi:hypothetical protein
MTPGRMTPAELLRQLRADAPLTALLGAPETLAAALERCAEVAERAVLAPARKAMEEGAEAAALLAVARGG